MGSSHFWGIYTKAWLYTIKFGGPKLTIIWWWKKLWKLKCPAKEKLVYWTILENKAPTWDVLQRRCFHGPGRCAFCCNSLETLDHLFLHCCYTQQIWHEVGIALNSCFVWHGPNFVEALRVWFAEGGFLIFK